MNTATLISERERAASLRAVIDAQAHALFDEIARQTQAPRSGRATGAVALRDPDPR